MSHYRLLDVVQRVIRPFTRIFRRMMNGGSEKLQIDVFPKYASVEQWYTGLVHVAWLPRKELAVSLRDSSLVKKLYLCRSGQARLLHEYLVAEVVVPGGMLVSVRIDRVQRESGLPPLKRTHSGTVQPRSVSPSSSCRSSVVSRRSSQSSLVAGAPNSSSSSSSYARRAQDTVYCYLDPPTPGDIAQCLVFKAGRELPLMDLVFVTFAAHEYDNTYEILGPQCYWYPACIYEVLKELVGAGGYQEKTKSSTTLERTPSQTDSILAGIYFPGDVAQLQPALHTGLSTTAVTTAVDPALSSRSSYRVGTNYNNPVTRTPRKDVINSVRHNYDRLKLEFVSMERDRVEELAAREADRAARIAAEERVEQLEAEVQRRTEAVEALRAEVARLQAVAGN